MWTFFFDGFLSFFLFVVEVSSCWCICPNFANPFILIEVVIAKQDDNVALRLLEWKTFLHATSSVR